MTDIYMYSLEYSYGLSVLAANHVAMSGSFQVKPQNHIFGLKSTIAEMAQNWTEMTFYLEQGGIGSNSLRCVLTPKVSHNHQF